MCTQQHEVGDYDRNYKVRDWVGGSVRSDDWTDSQKDWGVQNALSKRRLTIGEVKKKKERLLANHTRKKVKGIGSLLKKHNVMRLRTSIERGSQMKGRNQTGINEYEEKNAEKKKT